MDYNNSTNQRIKGKFVEREVLANVNSLIEMIKENDLNGEFWEEWENLEYQTCPKCYEQIETDSEICDNCEMDLSDIDMEWHFKEIFEYWAVSNYLYERLKAYGCPVWDTGSCYIWGRTTTGQAILLDWIISQICYELEMLEDEEKPGAEFFCKAS